MLSRSEILRAIRSAARKLKRAPTRAEFMRLTGIHYCKLNVHFPAGYRSAIRAAGLTPDPGGLRISTADLLTDWARLARKKHRIPTAPNTSAKADTPLPAWKPVFTAGRRFPPLSSSSSKLPE